MDRLTSLRVFALVADRRSFVAAAERLDLSPAMTSKHVQHLEAQLGVRLLNRTSRSVSLTEAGSLYLARIRPLLEGLDEAEAVLTQSAVEPRGVLKVSLPIWMANQAIARLIARFRAQFPNVVLDLDLSGRQVNLVDEGFDLAIRATFTLDEGLIARRLLQVPFVLVAAPALLDRIGRPQSLADLMGLPFLAYTPVAANGRIRLSDGGPELRFTPVLLSANDMLLLHAAREAMGLTFMPRPVVKDDLASGALEMVVPDLIQPVAPLFAVYPKREYLPAKVRCFLDFLIGLGDQVWDLPPG